MNEGNQFRIREASWERDRDRLRAIRKCVFVEEQGIAEELEWDGQDETSSHFIAETTDGRAVGTARLLASGQIGRMAVLPAARRKGIGSMLLNHIQVSARKAGLRELFLHAQVSVVPFYARHGFTPVGGVFDEAGIAHQTMRMTVQ